MKNTPLHYIVWKEGKYYVSQCINVDVSSFGNTKEDAVINLEEAIDLYREDNEIPEINIEKPEIISRDISNG